MTEGPAAAAARAELAAARVERDHAAHVIALLRIGAQDEDPPPAEVGADLRRRLGIMPPPGMFVRRREIELQVAELRLRLWSEELRRLESRLRGMGLRP